MPNNPEPINLPECWSEPYIVDGNKARQLIIPGQLAVKFENTGSGIWAKTEKNKYLLLNPGDEYQGQLPALRLQSVFDVSSPNLEGAEWEKSPKVDDCDEVLRSFVGNFNFKEDNPIVNQKGLRNPQIGALHSVLGYWTLDAKQPSTIVMPTGTGKTETMLSLFAAAMPKRLLVLVPSDALRKQIAAKFESLGILKEFGVVGDTTKLPVVGRVEHGFTNKISAKGFAQSCNIIVTTPNALMESDPEVWKTLVKECSHLFIDEAHHVAASTWRQIRDEFTGKPVTQFTATPFREDGALIGGKIIYSFPLRQAQEQGYFSKINYISVVDLDDPDKAIAVKAIEKLRADLVAGHDHVVMARAKSIKKAAELLKLYHGLASDLNPVIVYSSQKSPERKAAMASLNSRNSRIIVCVDMLGEGYDLPSLKIAAIHDPHKTLGITMQFVGRFARVSGGTIGEATVVVNRGDPQHDLRLKQLYAEDADWNYIIQDISANVVGEQEELNEFEQAFSELPEEISLRNIAPKMSTVVYKTHASTWHPDQLPEYFGDRLFTNPVAINETDKVAWFVTKDISQVTWGDVKSVENIIYSLFVCYWDSTNHTLYINSSANDGVYEDLAKLLCGDSVERFKGPDVYKTMATINRCVPTNVGLLDIMNGGNRFQMNVGSNVNEGFTDASRRNKTQTNIFAHGFEASTGAKVSIGASLKGRIWSHRAAPTLKHWTRWCDYVGGKLLDAAIDIEDVMKGFIIPEPVTTHPGLIALTLEWASEVFLNTSESIEVEINNKKWPIIDTDLVITEFKDSGTIPFNLVTPHGIAKYELVLGGGKMTCRSVNGSANIITVRDSITFSDFVKKQGLRVLLEKQAVLEPDMILLKPKDDIEPLDVSKLEAIDWTGIDLKKESQGVTRDTDSIQWKAWQHIEGLNDWDVIIDDDGSGEIADIVAIKIEGNKLVVNLVHCKYSSESSPGARVADLYEVCGQAQKSIQRRRKPELMLQNIIRRETNRRKTGRNNLLKGSDTDLRNLADKIAYLHPEFTITIVQPGLSKSAVSSQQLELLSATESYVSDTGGGTLLAIIVSS